MNWEIGDTFRWSYNDETLKKKNDGNNGGTTYWCVSRLAQVTEDGILLDTYQRSSPVSWTREKAEDLIDLEFIGNLKNDYRRASTDLEMGMYSETDYIDLRCFKYSTISGIFIRRDASPCGEKIKKVLLRRAYQEERNAAQSLHIAADIYSIIKSGEFLTWNSWLDLKYFEDVHLTDNSYMDEDIEND